MESEIARLLNYTKQDKDRLRELFEDYLNDSDEGENECETDDDSIGAECESDAGDHEQFDMRVTDCDLAMAHAASCPDLLSCSDEDELKKVSEFR